MAKVISSLPGSAGILSRTSQLTNDGESGVSTYVELDDISTVATTGDYNNLINVPINFTPKVHTHNISDISGTKSEFNTSLTDGDFLFVGDVLDTPDATVTTKGILKLTGDLGGTADNPTTPTAIHKIGDEIKHGILTLSNGLKIVGNTTSTTATKVNVQENDGTINTISKSDLVNVVEVNDVPSLPLVGEAGKIYVVKNVNKIYRWNGTFYQELAGTDISGLQAQIDLKANNSDVVKLTGNQSISGQKSFSLTGKIDMQTNNAFPAIRVTSLGSNGESAAEFINNSSSPYSTALRLQTSSSGGVGNTALNVLNQSPIGTGIFSNASNSGVSISSKSYNGDSYVSNIDYGGTGRNYVGRNNGIETYSVDKTGNVLGNSYIKRSTPATNILLAGGGDIGQNTAFNKNFGTTAGTVVEGGTLGSNAYNSTAYLPLSGGNLNGGLNGTSANFTSSVTATSFINSTAPATNALLANGTTLANPISGTGTTGYLPKFTSAGVLGNSVVQEVSNKIGIGITPIAKFHAMSSIQSDTYSIANATAYFNGVDVGLAVGQANVTGNYGTWLQSTKNDNTAFPLLLNPNGGNTTIRNAILTDTPTAPTAPAGTNTTQIATTAFVKENSRPYKVYTALLSQSGTNDPVATVLENTLGTVTFTRSSTGVYFVNSSGLFTADKTFVIMGAGANAGAINAINLINSSAFSIVTKALSTHSDADSANTKVAFEIRVYL